MECNTCAEELIEGFCPFGHDQDSEPDTIDAALESRRMTLGQMFSTAQANDWVDKVDPTSAQFNK